MLGNSILNKAKHSHNTDEWYTDYKTVKEEVTHYANIIVVVFLSILFGT
ncbi:MAG: hypothetical protein QNK89_05670 [Lacinutrix sp.]